MRSCLIEGLFANLQDLGLMLILLLTQPFVDLETSLTQTTREVIYSCKQVSQIKWASKLRGSNSRQQYCAFFQKAQENHRCRSFLHKASASCGLSKLQKLVNNANSSLRGTVDRSTVYTVLSIPVQLKPKLSFYCKLQFLTSKNPQLSQLKL